MYSGEYDACDVILWVYIHTDTDIPQHTPYQGFSVTGYIMNR
jgi:hypothetical protein